MKAVGITAEYNPMHTGHIWQLQEARRLSGAGCTVVVMSGFFTQRGTPAILDKYTRARAALLSGADLVLELPVVYATGSAELFALGAVRTLKELSVSYLSFGSESADLARIGQIARVLADEPESYTSCLRESQRQGKPFPAAREEAVITSLKSQTETGALAADVSHDAILKILRLPNDILATEYMKAAYRENASFIYIPVKRIGAGHDRPAEEVHDTPEDFTVPGALSASAIREKIKEASGSLPTGSERFLTALAPSLADGFRRCSYTTLDAEDFAPLLCAKLEDILYQSDYSKSKAAQRLTLFEDISESLAMRIINTFDPSLSFSEFVSSIKNRSITFSRVSRALCHILLGITKETALRYRGALPYIRILGFTKTGQEYLHEYAAKISCPIITKTADNKESFPEDRHAASLYRQVLAKKSGQKFPDEFHTGIIRI